MTRIANILKNRTTRIFALATAGVAGLIALPAMAPAGEHHDRGDVRVDINIGRPEARYEERTTRVWVEPVYQTVTQRVWVGPTYQTVCDRVWVPDRYETRDVVHGDRHHRWTTREDVLVEPAHWESRDRQVLVSDGHYEDVQQQQMIAPGHFEDRVERVRVEDSVRVDPFIDFFARFRR